MNIIFAPYPTSPENKKGGLSQRIIAIDSLFSEQKRLYLEVSYSKNFFLKKEVIASGVYLYKLNAFVHFFYILRLLSTADVVYLHTIGNGLKCLPYLYMPIANKFKTVCDMHGVVPEECLMFGRKYKSYLFSKIEKLLLMKVDTIICVSEVMNTHFREKYINNRFKSIVLPIFTIEKSNYIEGNKNIDRVKVKAIYAGGLQVWQNMDDMLDLVIQQPQINFDFWIPTEYLEKYRGENQHKNIKFHTGSQAEVKSAYAEMHLGIALRDSNIVNKVACPTKIVEYIECNVVPVLKSAEIGDFKKLGLKYFVVSELNEIDVNTIDNYSTINHEVLLKFREIIRIGKSDLIEYFKDVK